jgi:hypothetical protein
VPRRAVVLDPDRVVGGGGLVRGDPEAREARRLVGDDGADVEADVVVVGVVALLERVTNRFAAGPAASSVELVRPR